ncbi:MAG TPA: NUDIX domain-containing protein [Candidatus Bilamarchaeum sp.]|nr:NUDIX domain-containing protein [Candidatus Bilamarchaeum sp.]
MRNLESWIQEINAYLVIFHGERVLLLKRPGGLWEFPGGAVEWGERPETCAARETREETGLEAADISLLTVTSATYPKGEKQKHSIYVVFRGKASSDEVKLSDEHTEYRWLTVGEAKFVKPMALNAEDVLDHL